MEDGVHPSLNYVMVNKRKIAAESTVTFPAKQTTVYFWWYDTSNSSKGSEQWREFITESSIEKNKTTCPPKH